MAGWWTGIQRAGFALSRLEIFALVKVVFEKAHELTTGFADQMHNSLVHPEHYTIHPRVYGDQCVSVHLDPSSGRSCCWQPETVVVLARLLAHSLTHSLCEFTHTSLSSYANKVKNTDTAMLTKQQQSRRLDRMLRTVVVWYSLVC